MKEMALEITTDVDHKFDLAVQLKRLDVAEEIARNNDSEAKWKQLGDLALGEWDFVLAEHAFRKSNDLSTLFLMYSSMGNRNGLAEIGEKSKMKGDFSLAFNAFYLSGRVEECVCILQESGSFAEAALMSRSYKPSLIAKNHRLWQNVLLKMHHRAADLLASPETHPELFSECRQTLEEEQQGASKHEETIAPLPVFSNEASPVKKDSAAVSAVGDEEVRETNRKGAAADNFSDNQSHLSMEVNTTGTGSIKGDFLDDDLFADAAGDQMQQMTINDDDLDMLLK